MSPSRSASAVPTPQWVFAPARLWTTARPSASRIVASMRAVVVLPLVALINVTPLPSRAASVEIARGAMRSSSRPGEVVPPPRPEARLTRPAARAIASLVYVSDGGSAIATAMAGSARSR
jgi:hypothetical protein